MRKLKILPVLVMSVVLLAGCGDQGGNFEGAVMGDPAAGADAATDEPSEDASDEPSEDASEDASDEPSEDASEDASDEPSEDASEDASDEPSEDASEDPSEGASDESGTDGPGADPDLELPDAAPATGKTIQKLGVIFNIPSTWKMEKSYGKDTLDFGPKSYNGESLHVFVIKDVPYANAQEMAPDPGQKDTTDYGFVTFGGQEWTFSSQVADPTSGRRMYSLQTPHKKNGYYLTFWDHSSDPEKALENIQAIMATWKFV